MVREHASRPDRETIATVSGTPDTIEIPVVDKKASKVTRRRLTAVTLECQQGPIRAMVEVGVSGTALNVLQGWVRDLGAGNEPITSGSLHRVLDLTIDEGWIFLVRWDNQTGTNENLFLAWLVEVER